jgi:predicted HAD superfamily Cof-like phosphohydrolase
MLDMVEDVLAFHRKFACYVGDYPHLPRRSIVDLRLRLIREEYRELLKAIRLGDLAGIADAIADLVYVIIGTAIAFGIDIRPIWQAVQQSNMAKTGGGTRGDGKILKPPGWRAPDVAGLVARQTAFAQTHGGSLWRIVSA